jgi:hypothetical protein
MGIYVYRNDQVEGPFDELVLQQALANGTMASDQLCCKVGTDEWKFASDMFSSKPPALPQIPSLVLPSVPSLQPTPFIALPSKTAWKFRWRWSYLFWAPWMFYLTCAVYGCLNQGNAIQKIEQIKLDIIQELNQRKTDTHVASVIMDAAIGADRQGNAGAIRPLLAEAERQEFLQIRLKEADYALSANRALQNQNIAAIVCLIFLSGAFLFIRWLAQWLMDYSPKR